MSNIKENLHHTMNRIRQAESMYHRDPGSVQLLAVSKGQGIHAIQAAYTAGQRAFGENYLQEALSKIAVFKHLPIEWHFIGTLQANKTRQVAQNFSWVHSINRWKIAKRLSEQRPPELTPLNLCIEVNISNEQTKSGLPKDKVEELAHAINSLPNLRLRGLMVIPQPTKDLNQLFATYQQVQILQLLLAKQGLPLDTLSMGMSSDLELAIAAGSTLVRIGTGIFGSR